MWRRSAAFLILLALSAAAFGSTLTADGIEVSYVAKVPGAGSGNYMPVHVSLWNTGMARQLQVAIVSNYPCRSRITRSISVAQGQRVSFDLLAPAFESYGSFHGAVFENGREIPGLTDPVAWAHRNDVPWPGVLIISDHDEDLRAIRDALRGRVVGVDPPVGQLLYYEMPEGWIAYTRVDLIGVSAKALEAMTSTQREDLRKWVATGGSLFIYRPSGTASGLVELLLGKGAALGPDQVTVPHYFGRVHLVRADALDWDKERWGNQIKRMEYLPGRFGSQGRDVRPANIPGVGRPPVRVYGFIIVLFAIAIGPVNYFMLKRKRKLHLLFFITPMAALAVTAGMIVYGVFAEGLGIKVHIEGVTWLDQDRHEAVTTGRMSIYAGMRPSGGLWFPMDTAALPAAGDFGSGLLELGDGQRFLEGWLPPRTIVEYSITSVAPARARLRIERDGDGYRVTNGLEASINDIVVMDREGKFYRAANIAPGGSTKAVDRHSLRRDLSAFLGALRSPMMRRAELVNGSYLAVLDRSPFFQVGTPKIEERGSLHVLYGRLAEQADARAAR